MSCSSSLKFKTQAVKPSAPQQSFLFGSSTIDITPPPGYPMGGFGSEGRISRGVWTPLKAAAFYFQDPGGNQFVLVSCDLWSVPLGLSLRVGELLNEEPDKTYHLGTPQILISATHTHHSHGGFSTSEAYNALATPVAGFDENLFNHLALRITQTIKEAIDNRRAAVIARWQHTLEGLIRNRSYDAFNRINPTDSLEITSHVNHSDQYFPRQGLPVHVTRKEQFTAVDPYVTSLLFYPRGATTADPMAMINFCSFHPTVLGTHNELYSRDVMGVIDHRIRQKMGWWNTDIGFINGSEGDISCNWYQQDLKNALDIGIAMADSILSSSRSSFPLTGNVQLSYDIVPITDRDVAIPFTGSVPACFNQLPKRTAKVPYPGIGTVGGAEDGRTDLFYKGLKEGMTSQQCTEGHGNKLIALKATVEHMFAALPAAIHPAIEYVFKKMIKDTAPRSLPIGVHSIGDISIVSLPGEITTTLGYKIRSAVANARNYSDYHQVLLAGLTNEYLSYFTTPAEYAEQEYEGASMMYGYMGGSFLEQEAGRIASTSSAQFENEYKFKPGKDLHLHTKHNFRIENWTVEEGLEPYLVDLDNGSPFNHYPVFQFKDSQVIVDVDPSKTIYYPSVKIMKKNPSSGSWDMYINGDQSLSLASFIRRIDTGISTWGILWTPETSVPLQGEYRYEVLAPSGKRVTSSPFVLEEVMKRNIHYIIK